MQNNILINELNIQQFDGYDANTNTLTFENKQNQTYHIEFDNESIDQMSIKLVNSNITIIENYKGKIASCHFDIDIDENSKLSRFSILVYNEEDQTIIRNVNNKGYYESMQIDLTENSIDSTENINLCNQEAYASVIDGIYAVKKSSKKYQTNLNHYEPNGTSKAQIFAINNDEAHVSIFTDAFIKNGASRTITNQEGRIINLTDTCFGIVLPNLHIDENDVEASHSCSVGSVNQDHMYYLQTRGLTHLQARNILIKGYFNPILMNIDDEKIKEELNSILEQRIG